MEKKQTVSIVIPVYNEEVELASSVRTLVAYLKIHLQDFHWEVIIADNASTDKTYVIAKKLSIAFSSVRVLHLKEKGRGRAVKKAWTESTSDFCAYLDVDLSTDLKHLPGLIRSLQRGYDVAIGTRNAWGSRVYGRSFLRTITSKGYIALIKMFFLVRFSDAQCGFKAVSRKIINQVLPLVEDTGWFFDTEMLLIAEKSGFRVYEEPVTWIDNPGSTVRVMKTAQGDLFGLKRLFFTRPWLKLQSRKEKV
jgi:glycosyltransferase involved in cell wall biosynthesis